MRVTPSYLGYLHAPVEQVLGADVVLVLPDVVQQAAVGHQLGDELHGGGEADAEQAAHVGVIDAGHHVSLLRGRRHVEREMRKTFSIDPGKGQLKKWDIGGNIWSSDARPSIFFVDQLSGN